MWRRSGEAPRAAAAIADEQLLHRCECQPVLPFYSSNPVLWQFVTAVCAQQTVASSEVASPHFDVPVACHTRTCRGSVEAAKELLDQGADVNCENARGSTPVRSISRGWGDPAGGMQLGCWWVAMRTSITACPTTHGPRPLPPTLQLHFAAAAKSRTRDICELLLDAGADTGFSDLQARTPVEDGGVKQLARCILGTRAAADAGCSGSTGLRGMPHIAALAPGLCTRAVVSTNLQEQQCHLPACLCQHVLLRRGGCHTRWQRAMKSGGHPMATNRTEHEQLEPCQHAASCPARIMW